MAKKQSVKKSNPVPSWCDRVLAKDFERLDITGRMILADKLEEKAAQLRGFAQKPIQHDERTAVSFTIGPNQKAALLHYVGRFGAHVTDPLKLHVGARWVFEVALTMLDLIVAQTSRMARYRDSEGVEDSRLFEARAAEALKKIAAA